MKGIADTGLIVALLNRDDSHHKWALEIARMVSEPLLTCESVLSEAGFQVDRSSGYWILVREGFLEIAFDLSKNFEEIAELGQRYGTVPPIWPTSASFG